MRASWDEYFMEIAEIVKTRSTCLRRQVGAVIVKDNRILTTGYNGSPAGTFNCIDKGTCKRIELGIPSGERHELCRALHAEQNAMLSAARKDMIGADLYLVAIRYDTSDYEIGATSCQMCRKLIINSGIKHVYIRVNKNE